MQSLLLEDLDTVVHWHDLPGVGAPLVCLPALGMGAAANFLDVVCDPALAGRRRILIDLPGSGYSPPARNFDHTPKAHADVVARVLDHLAPGPAVLFGHSLGGSVAIALAAVRPDLVRHLVVAEGNVTPGGGTASREIAAQDPAAYVAQGHAAKLQDFRARAAAGNAFLAFLHASWALADPASLHGNAAGLVTLDPQLETAFLTLDRPRTFLYGAKSLARGAGAADVPHPEQMRAHGIATRVIPEAGHFMTYDTPQSVAQVLRGVLATD